MRRFLIRMREALDRLRNRKPAPVGLTAVEYEAVSLIAYEGRDAYHRARQQAFYCRARGSESGFVFWSQVSLEVSRRGGASVRDGVGGPSEGPP